MNWADERYVRLYTRDTATWKMLSWQSKALLSLLLRKLDRAGVIELGEDGLEALSFMVELPLEVVETGLDGLLKRKTVVWSGTALVMPKFLEAQEVPITDAQRKRDQRERERSKHLENTQGESRGVTRGHAESRGVTPSLAVPNLTSRDNPNRSEPETFAGIPSEVPQQGQLVETKESKKPDPRHSPITKALGEDFKQLRGAEYAHCGGKDAKAVTLLLAKGIDAEIRQRWRRGLNATGWLRCNTIHDLAARWNGLTEAPGRAQDVRKGVARADEQDWTGDGGYGALNASGGVP